MRKPEPEDFGILSQEYEQAAAERIQLRKSLSFLSFSDKNESLSDYYITIMIGLFFGSGIGLAIGFALRHIGLPIEDRFLIIFVMAGGTIGVSYCLIMLYRDQRILKELSDPIYNKIDLYDDAMKKYELCQENYWKSLRGVEFEKALAKLYRSLGYSVQETKGSHDEGIDLILDEKIIVQCKGHEKSISVGIIRELYGTLKHQTEFESAVLACPAGFTDGVRAFAYGKPIELLALKEIIEMAERVSIGKKKNKSK